MCKQYVSIKQDEQFINEAEKYYDDILMSSKINWNLKGWRVENL